MPDMRELLDSLPQVGCVVWIGLALAPRGGIRPVEQAVARVGTGLEGDHHAGRNPGGKRQVTLIQSEHLPVVAALLGKERVEASWLRRNIVVQGINLVALRQRRFRIGEAVLEGTGECAPCSRMEEVLGPGGFNAMRGHGGITARVIEGGAIRIGDAVSLLIEAEV